MPRSIWNGAISFGLVVVPVRLYSATQERDVHFSQFEKGSGEKIRYQRVAEESGDEVPFEEIVKGYEVEKGRFVIVTPEELESVQPGKSRSIEIGQFISLDEIDPIYFEKTYYLAPDEGTAVERAYRLLHRAMEEERKAAIGRFVMREKQYLCAIRPFGGIMALETMFFPDEVRDPAAVEVPDVSVPSRELQMARAIIDNLTDRWDPDRYHDTYRERVLDLIERKAKGEEAVVERPAAPDSNVTDLMTALRASVEASRKKETGGGSRGAAAGKAKKRPAKKAAAKAGRYGSMTKEELYEEAQRRDIPGRSGMSRDELVAALERHARAS